MPVSEPRKKKKLTVQKRRPVCKRQQHLPMRFGEAKMSRLGAAVLGAPLVKESMGFALTGLPAASGPGQSRLLSRPSAPTGRRMQQTYEPRQQQQQQQRVGGWSGGRGHTRRARGAPMTASDDIDGAEAIPARCAESRGRRAGSRAGGQNRFIGYATPESNPFPVVLFSE